MPIPPLLQAVIAFVRKGYPQGVPEHDYLPLFALLRRRLSEEEVAEIAAALIEDAAARRAVSRDPASQRPASQDAASQDPAAIREAIARLIREPPSETDIERVRARLGAAGWRDETR